MDIDAGGAAPAAKAAPTPKKNPDPPAAAAAASGQTVKEFKLADIGEGIAEVTVTEWFIKEGDTVKEMDNLCAVESDKASVELTSPFAGKVRKVLHKTQDVVKVGSVLVEIEVEGATPSTESPAAV